MARPIPTFTLDVLANSDVPALDVFMLGPRMDDPTGRFGLPYRSTYFAVGVCLHGRAQLSIDLEHCELGPRTAVAIPPQAIKQWHSMSADFEHLVVFFTRHWITDRTSLDPDRFACFESGQQLLELPLDSATAIAASLGQVRTAYDTASRYRDEILKARITALLYELEALHRDVHPAHRTPPSRGRTLADAFRRLVAAHFAAERQVKFYADALSVTPRHLSSTVHEQTGKTASAWIQETVVLEARVMLLDPDLTVAQVADRLKFPDPSTFGKYFKQHTGTSPRDYQLGTAGRRPTS
ncbi:helix-turn-helix domain-containing protein [soil metagenome]